MSSNPVPPATKQFRLKLAERVIWTAIQAALALISVETIDAVAGTNLPAVWVPVIAALLSSVKGYVARRVGNPQEPATLPWGV